MCSRFLTAKAKAVAEREAAEAAVFHFRAKDVPDRIRESKSIDFEAEEKQREDERKLRIKQAAAAKCAAAALPPRMQARMEQEKESGSGHGSKAVAPEHSFAPEINGVVPDFVVRTLSNHSFATVDVFRDPHFFSDDLSEFDRCAAWAVFFVPVMPFNNFHVCSSGYVAQGSGGLLDELHSDVHRSAGVGS
jgi:hypothetical protein